MKCRIRCVMPREERRRTRCLFLSFFGAGAWISSSSMSMISSAFRFPLPFASALAAFAFCVFKSEAIVCETRPEGGVMRGATSTAIGASEAHGRLRHFRRACDCARRVASRLAALAVDHHWAPYSSGIHHPSPSARSALLSFLSLLPPDLQVA